ncbi:VOC family protein [Shinella sp. 838]|jgi:predicted lactoylglutathione lyase|uniref:VOC family protein n=1 Tax=unclassified Shinella TaxID=2643062 RepID=UPI0003C55B14|nr:MULTISPECIES: VOC family protein [unclassified Shinella]EYR79168.1 glyoxalase/bleomycin resistance protein/dioxygenase [Shinella sp. DD12]MCA0342935.1 VOC family protein [Pseudomonadota bacterium]MDG4671244.1 VOC family protein [Shinella sp. 838]TAA63147.1 glyoxalase [Shinella sp. JR1-6]
MRMIFVNLLVKDLPATRRFFGALGFSFNEAYSDETAACMVVDDNIFVMHLTEPKFAQFVTGKVGDPEEATQVLTCLSAASRQEVDDIKAKALAAGGREWKPNIEFGPMYGCSFQDPNGNVWEFMHMDQSGG